MSPAVAAVTPDLDELRRSLVATGDRYATPPWLAAAHLDPAGFWQSVAPVLAAAPGGSARSSLFERYHLFHDLGARHAVGRRVALVEHDDASGLRHWSYAAIVDDARSLATAWRVCGVGPGMCVAIVEPPSRRYLSALLAAWHCGAIAAPVPVWGRTYVLDRLAALTADAVATEPGRALWLELPASVPIAAPPADDGVAPHRYAPDEIALRTFSPLGTDALTPLDVTAERVHLGALRDGALLLGLGPDIGVCAPGFSEVRDGLALRLAALSTGARMIDLTLDAALAQPALLTDARVDVLGVTPALRDALLAAGDDAGVCPARWIRSPATAHQPAIWERLARRWPRSLGATYFASPAAGGAIAFSPWRRAPALNEAVPAPGHAWQLLEPNGSGQPALDGTGVLTSAELPVDAVGRPLLTAHGDDSMWLSSLGAHRDGECLPAAEIVTLVARCAPAVWASGLVDYPLVGGGRGAVLVVFLRPDEIEAGSERALADAIRDTIELELAPHLVPDHVEPFTVAPRFDDDGALDGAWCQTQYLSGRLARKQREVLFGEVARLRCALDEGRA